MIRKRIVLMVFFVYNCTTWAQNISVSFEKFPSKRYTLIGYKGTKTDTIVKGQLDKQGNAKLKLPASVKNYQGMVSLVMDDDIKLEMILNNENFSVSSIYAYPDTRTSQFKGSEENQFFKNYLLGDELIINSKLYANQLKNGMDYFNRILAAGKATDKEIEKLRFDFIDLNLSELYYSPLWKNTLTYWVAMHNNRIKDDDKLITDAFQVMKNCKQEAVLDEFANNLIDICEQYGWEYIKNQLVLQIYNSGSLKTPTRNLAILLKSRGIQIGETPPDFSLNEKTKLSSLFKDKLLLFFYDSNCYQCSNEIKELKIYSDKLTENKIKIVSISLDANKEDLEANTKDFSWKYKLNDPDNHLFHPYGVIMTPTYFVIEKGKITGRYARLLDTGLYK